MGLIEFQGPELTREKLDELIAGVPEDKYQVVFDNYFEYIPSGEWTDKQKLEFVICSIPMVGELTSDIVTCQLLCGPSGGPNDREYMFTKPNIYAALKDREDYKDLLKQATEIARERKYIPIDVPDEWLCLLALAVAIDIASEAECAAVHSYDEFVGILKKFVEYYS